MYNTEIPEFTWCYEELQTILEEDGIHPEHYHFTTVGEEDALRIAIEFRNGGDAIMFALRHTRDELWDSILRHSDSDSP